MYIYIYESISLERNKSEKIISAILEKLQRSGVQPSERLASLGIMGTQVRIPLKPLKHFHSLF